MSTAKSLSPVYAPAIRARFIRMNIVSLYFTNTRPSRDDVVDFIQKNSNSFPISLDTLTALNPRTSAWTVRLMERANVLTLKESNSLSFEGHDVIVDTH